MNKRIIIDGEILYSTGVFLIRDSKIEGGYRVSSFEDDSFFNGMTVEDIESNEPYIESSSNR